MQNNPRIFAVVNRKGGVGKTTTAVTLAHGLARKLNGNGHALIVDLDPQGNVASSLGFIDFDYTVADLLEGKASLESCCFELGLDNESREGLWVVPADDDLQYTKEQVLVEAGINSVMQSRRRGQQAQLKPDLIKRRFMGSEVFDFIILDCPPSLDILRDDVYSFADAAIVPVKPDYLGAAGTAQHTDDIREAQKHGLEIEIAQLVPTFYRQREILANQMLDSLRRKYGQSKVGEPIPQAVILERASAAGKTIFEYAPESAAALAYQELVDSIWKISKMEVANAIA
jgi:chromosome partitioning protein